MSIVVSAITPENDPPVASNLTLFILEDTPGSVAAVVTDPDGDLLTVTVVDFPVHGSVVYDPATGEFLYTPDPEFSGVDSFTYRANDGQVDSNLATVTITVETVNDPPELILEGPATISLDAGGSVELPMTITDVDSELTSLQILPSPALGAVEVLPDGFLRYTALEGVEGTETLTFVAVDDQGAESEPVTRTFLVSIPNQAPTALAPEPIQTGRRQPVSFTLAGEDPEGVPLTFLLITPPAVGELVLNPNGTATYTPPGDFAGTVTFTFAVNDGALGSEPVEGTIQVVNALPVADSIEVTIAKNQPAGIQLSGSDSDGDPLEFLPDALPQSGTLILSPDGLATYTPNLGFEGVEVFTYRISDGLDTSEPGTVTVVVVNQPPTVEPLAVEGPEDAPVLGTLAFFDPDGDPVTLEVQEGPPSGTLTLDPATGSFEYLPESEFSGVVSFLVVASDGTAQSDPQTVTITVLPVDDPPALNPEFPLAPVTRREGAPPLTLSLEGLFLDPDSEVVLNAFSSDSSVVQASVDGFILTLVFGAAGTAVVEIGAEGAAETASLQVEVLPPPEGPNSPPVVTPPGEQVVREGETLQVSVQAEDAEEDPLLFTLVGVQRLTARGAADTTPEVSVHPETGVVSFTVQRISGLFQRFRVQLTVADPTNPPVPVEFLVTVQTANEPPAVSAPEEVAGTLDAPVEVPVAADDPNAADLLTLRVGAVGSVPAVVSDAVRAFNQAAAPTVEGHIEKTFTINPTPELAGTLVTLRWTATDNRGASATAQTTIAFGEVNRPPVIAPIADQQAEEGGSWTLALSVRDPEGGSVAVQISGLPPAVVFDPQALTLQWPQIGFDQSGSFTVRVRATDEGGASSSRSFRLTVRDVNRPPVIELASTGTDLPGEMEVPKRVVTTHTVRASDPDGEAVSLVLSGAPSWVQVQSGGTLEQPTLTLRIEPPEDAGAASIQVVASDPRGGESRWEPTLVPVRGPNRAPVFASLTPRTVQETQTLRVPIAATDPDGDSVTVTAESLPEGATFDGIEFLWTPPLGAAQPDPYAAVFVADDGQGRPNSRVRAELPITVAPRPNAPPELLFIPDAVLPEGETIIVELAPFATDPDNDPLGFAVETSFDPDHTDFDSETGEITFRSEPGVPNASAGFYNVTVRVSDGRGGEAVGGFLLIVEPQDGAVAAAAGVEAPFVNPATATPGQTVRIGGVVRNPTGELPATVIAEISPEGGDLLSLTLTSTDVDVVTGMRYETSSVFATGVYTVVIVAQFADQEVRSNPVSFQVRPAQIALRGLQVVGASGDILANFELVNPNPGYRAGLLLQYRAEGQPDWNVGTGSGDLNDLTSGTFQAIWHSGADVPGAAGGRYQIRITETQTGAAISSPFFVLWNAPPPAPVLEPIPPSATPQLVVQGSGAAAGSTVQVFANGAPVGAGLADDGGGFSVTTDPLESGRYDIAAQYTTPEGVVSALSDPVEAVLDTRPPQIRMISPDPGSEVANEEPLIAFTVDWGTAGPSSDPDAVTVTLNGDPFPVAFDPATGVYAGQQRLISGRGYVVVVRARNAVNVTGILLSTFSIVPGAADTTPPTFAAQQPTGVVNVSLPPVSVAIGDTDSGIDSASVSAQLDGIPVPVTVWAVQETSAVVELNLSEPLSDGEHQVQVDFADNAGNTAQAVWSFTVDTAPPTPPGLGSEGASAPGEDQPFAQIVREGTVQFQGQAEPGLELLFLVNRQLAAQTRVGEDGTWSVALSLPGEGAHEIQVQARDAVGNLSPPSDPVRVLYDRTAPVLELYSPALGAPSASLRPTFRGVLRDALSGVDPGTFRLLLDGEPVAAQLDPAAGVFTFTPEASFAADAVISVRIEATDLAGNAALVEGTLRFQVGLADVNPPKLLNARLGSRFFRTGAELRIAEPTAELSLIVTDDQSGVRRVFGTLDGREIGLNFQEGRASLVLEEIAIGPHLVLLQAEDQAGNRSRVYELRFRRVAPPDPPTLEVPELTNRQNLIVRGTLASADLRVVVLVNGSPAATRQEGTRFQAPFVRLKPGENEIVAIAEDSLGQETASEAKRVVLDTAAPRVGFLSPRGGVRVPFGVSEILLQVGDNLGVEWSSLQMSVDGAPVTPSAPEDGVVRYQAPEPFSGSEEGPVEHFVTVVVRDLAGNETRSSIRFLVDSSPVVIANPIPYDGEEVPTAEPFIGATITADDLDFESVVVRFGEEGGTLRPVHTDPSFALDRRSGQFGFTPAPLEDGKTYRVLVQAADRAGNTAEFSWSFSVNLQAQDEQEPVVTVLRPREGEDINDTGLDILSFSVGDASGVAEVILFVNDPTGQRPLNLSGLEEAGVAQFNRDTGVVTIDARRLFVPLIGARGGFSLDPLELNTLERSLTGGSAAFDPLELNTLERSLTGGSGASFDPLELNTLERSLGAETVGSVEQSLRTATGLLGVGTNTIGVQVTDLSGNVGFMEWSFDVVTEPPSAPVLETSLTVTRQSTITVRGRVPDLSETSPFPIAVSLKVNGASAGVVQVKDVSGSFEVANVALALGNNDISAVAQDAAGNLSAASATYRVFLDQTKPTLQAGTLPSASQTASLNLSGTVSDNYTAGAVSVSALVNGEAVPLSVSGGRYSGTITLSEGLNTVQIRAVDAAGNETLSPAQTVSLDTQAPGTAPAGLSARPSTDGRGVVLSWGADPNADRYDVYRSTLPIVNASDLTPIARDVRGTRFTDSQPVAGQTVFYALVSVDAAGNRDPRVVSRPLDLVFLTSPGGTLQRGAIRVEVPANGIFSNRLLGAVLRAVPAAEVPSLEGVVPGTAFRVEAINAQDEVVEEFNRPVTVRITLPPDLDLEENEVRFFRLVGETWEEVPGASLNPATRQISVTVDGSATVAVQAVPKRPPAPWDVTGDGVVNIVDLATVARFFGQRTSGPADVNGDGLVNIVDLATVAAHFGEQVTPTAPGVAPRPVALRVVPVVERSGDGALELVLRSERPLSASGVLLRLAESSEQIGFESPEPGRAFGGAQTLTLPFPERPGLRELALLRVGAAHGRPDAELVRVRVRAAGRMDPETMLRQIRIEGVELSDTQGRLYFGRLSDWELNGLRPTRTALLPNYPNPFNPETWIPFLLAEPSEVTLTIYNATGEVVRRLSLGYRDPGSYTDRQRAARWDGRNALGEPVASGVYFVTLRAGSQIVTRKIVVAK
ncbi:MAG: hypothetical protein KatS3mg115_1416 [Candidatus Poribacteria bacterium]|nr:MAG: hypothetical protein KatS3mg115_1416 [Candidatus Poribacteria bacterium]